jgi:hypothetical protein
MICWTSEGIIDRAEVAIGMAKAAVEQKIRAARQRFFIHILKRVCRVGCELQILG